MAIASVVFLWLSTFAIASRQKNAISILQTISETQQATASIEPATESEYIHPEYVATPLNYLAQAGDQSCSSGDHQVSKEQCFDIATQLVIAGGNQPLENRTVKRATRPPGCIVNTMSWKVWYNEDPDGSPGLPKKWSLVCQAIGEIEQDRSQPPMEQWYAWWSQMGHLYKRDLPQACEPGHDIHDDVICRDLASKFLGWRYTWRYDTSLGASFITTQTSDRPGGCAVELVGLDKSWPTDEPNHYSYGREVIAKFNKNEDDSFEVTDDDQSHDYNYTMLCSKPATATCGNFCGVWNSIVAGNLTGQVTIQQAQGECYGKFVDQGTLVGLVAQGDTILLVDPDTMMDLKLSVDEKGVNRRLVLVDEDLVLVDEDLDSFLEQIETCN